MKRILSLLLLTAAIGATSVYLYNGRCFACDTDPDPTDYCTKHLGPCDTQHARIEYDQCDSNKCPNCDTCGIGGTYTCCYNGQYMCTDDAHLGQPMYDKQCKTSCVANHQPGTIGGTCPQGMLCE